ncbi:hypothetical protein ACL02S_05540 [Nocardia sp. 004]|uniref:hypothetical protein n=1 Tax=Nocardia sp. 004 TaxID=3385978 RepID=UPI0039A26CDD
MTTRRPASIRHSGPARNIDPNHLYLDRVQLRELVELLREIPELVEDLGIALTKQARLSSPGDYRMHRRPSEQPLPYNQAAALVADELHAVLVSWVRLVCEQRGIEYSGAPSTPGLARWLDRNVIALAMTEGVQDAPTDVRAVVKAAWQVICPSEARATVDHDRVEQARQQRMNVSGIVALAKELDESYRGLTARRVRTLRDAQKVAPVPGPWAPEWPELYVVGEVLDAHLAYPVRKRVRN